MTNLFKDDGTLVDGDNIKLYNPPVLRNRKPVEYIKVICKCGRIDHLPKEIAILYNQDPLSSDIAMEYKCQECIRKLKK